MRLMGLSPNFESGERHCLYAVRRGGLASGINDESAPGIVREKAFDRPDVVGHDSCSCCSRPRTLYHARRCKSKVEPWICTNRRVASISRVDSLRLGDILTPAGLSQSGPSVRSARRTRRLRLQLECKMDGGFVARGPWFVFDCCLPARSRNEPTQKHPLRTLRLRDSALKTTRSTCSKRREQPPQDP